MNKRLLFIQIIETIFLILMIIIGVLELNSTIYKENGYIVYLSILPIVYWVIIVTLFVIIMYKYKEKEKKLLKDGIIISIEILLITLFVGSIDIRMETIRFIKNSEETIGTVYDVEVNEKKDSSLPSDGRNLKYVIRKKYYYEYKVDGQIYKSVLESSNTSNGNSYELVPAYKIGDKLKVYYKKDDPNKCKTDISYFSKIKIITFLIIAIVIRIYEIVITLVGLIKEHKENFVTGGKR